MITYFTNLLIALGIVLGTPLQADPANTAKAIVSGLHGGLISAGLDPYMPSSKQYYSNPVLVKWIKIDAGTIDSNTISRVYKTLIPGVFKDQVAWVISFKDGTFTYIYEHAYNQLREQLVSGQTPKNWLYPDAYSMDRGLRPPNSGTRMISPAKNPSDAVVRIDSDCAMGSGSIVSPSGHILTAKHVADLFKYTRAKITLPSGQIYSAHVVYLSPNHDAALMKIDQVVNNLPFIKVSQDDTLLAGTDTTLWGYAGGSLRVKYLKFIERWPGCSDNLHFGKGIAPGDSGGPILNSKNEQVGIGVAVMDNGNSLGVEVRKKPNSNKILVNKRHSIQIKPDPGYRYV